MGSKSKWTEPVIGLILSLAAALSCGLRWPLLDGWERWAYDLRAQLSQNLDPAPEIILVSIDSVSISRLGQWPWPRTRIADMVDLLSKSGAKVIGLDILYAEPEQNTALAELVRLRSDFDQGLSARKISQKGMDFRAAFSEAAARLDTDARLSASVRSAANVIFPMFFADAGRLGGKPALMSPALAAFALPTDAAPEAADSDPYPQVMRAVVPLSSLIEAGAGLGHVNVYPEADGVLRREAAAVRYGSSYFPSFAVMVAARYLDLRPQDLRLTPGRSLELGSKRVPLDARDSFHITFNGAEGTFRNYSFLEVQDGKVEPDVFRGKIVIVGVTAPGQSSPYATPVSRGLPSPEIVANAVENILDSRFLTRPPWAGWLEAAMLLACALFLSMLLPRIKASGGAAVGLLMMVMVAASGSWLFAKKGHLIPIVHPMLLLAVGWAAVAVRRLMLKARPSTPAQAALAPQMEKARADGVQLQAEGRLEEAFESLRPIELDLEVAELCYRLGRDFEASGQPAKAVAVYRHVAEVYPRHRDVGARIRVLEGASEREPEAGTQIIAGSNAAEEAPSDISVAIKPAKARIGRYEVIAEIGRGAMGVVYMGKDPKVGRRVAIKTMAVGAGLTPTEAKEARERFFREAESAGTLNHPGIVHVFDAGQDGDDCFIAMEFLEGKDFTSFIHKESLLPFEKALEYVAGVAAALDYAHAQKIVHLDIKPANLMLLKDGTVRVADFGIARALMSPKAGPAVILGTPSYMSPEQVAGRKVDGRSDLFSLGVVLFELLAGEKPFKGSDSSVGSILYQIVNAPEQDLGKLRPGLHPHVVAVVRRALRKSPAERFQTGGQMVQALRACPGMAPVKSAPPSGAPTPEEIANSLILPGVGQGGESAAEPGPVSSAGSHVSLPRLEGSEDETLLAEGLEAAASQLAGEDGSEEHSATGSGGKADR